MKKINEVIREIGTPDEKARVLAKARWDAIAKPMNSLGSFEEMIMQIAALKGTAVFSLEKRALMVFCADNGVVAQEVSQCGSEVTGKVAVSLAEGRSTANTMAARAGCRVIPADVGMLDFPGHPGIRNMRVRNGTGDISREAAMTEEECLNAMAEGAAMAEELCREGMELLAVGEMGIGNTTTATALAAALLGLNPDEITGRGAGLSTAGLERKKSAIRAALRRAASGEKDTVRLMAELGGLDIAAMCGACLGAAANRIPVIIDGMITATAAYCACLLCPGAKAAMLASHISTEGPDKQLLKALELKAPLDAGMHLGEGTGALMLMPLLDMALEVFQRGQNFERLGIEAYQPLR